MNEKKASFDVVYDGPALADGSMNVKDLAPAMLAVGALFDEANQVANGERAKININVRATSPGSFHILYDVVQTTTQVIDINALVTASYILNLVIGVGISAPLGLIKLIGWANRRKPKLEKVNDELFRLTIGEQTYDVPLPLLKLYQSATARHAIADMFSPVKVEGINGVRLLANHKLVHEITKDNIDAYEVPESQEQVLDEIRRQAFSIVSLSFKEDNKWRLTDGHNTFIVSMKDIIFQKRVDDNLESFSRGDILICDLRTIQWQVEDGIKTAYEVVKVVEHRPARQLPLFE